MQIAGASGRDPSIPSSVDEHFAQSLHLGGQPLPSEQHPVLDADLIFAADMHGRRTVALLRAPGHHPAGYSPARFGLDRLAAAH